MTLTELARERPFEPDELAARLAATREAMDALGLDLVLLTDQDDVFYLTGARRLGGLMLAGLLIAAEGEPVFVSRAVDAQAFATQTGLPTRGYSDGELPEYAIVDAIRALDLHGSALGAQFGSPSLPVAALRRLETALPSARWEDATRVVWDQRAAKSESELRYLREAAAMNTHALDRAIAAIRPGVTDSRLAAELFAGMLEAGSDEIGFFILASGENTGVVHATYENRTLRQNDHVHFEFSAARFRYHAPLMRTVTLGRPSRVVECLHAGAEAGLEAALATIRAGVTSGEVDAAANAAIARAGVRQWHFHRTGYSVGIMTGRAWPEGHIVAIRDGDETTLREDMVFHLPMVLFEPGVAGAGLSETIRVTADGVEVLTWYRRELIRL